MSAYFAALPMYDWPEEQAETDGTWAGVRAKLHAAGIDVRDELVRRNADMPAVPGGIHDEAGRLIAPDPAILPPDDFDLFTLWRHPGLVFSQTCWGPLSATGLDAHVTIIAQPDYSNVEGGHGPLYSSAIVMRGEGDIAPVPDGSAHLPLERMRGQRFAFNNPDSMSGLLGIAADLEASGEGLDIFADRIETGGHRASALAVANGEGDVAAIDCRSWALFKRLEPAAAGSLRVAGWTARRKGLPYVRARALPQQIIKCYPTLA
ncbi:PhnD/SsuA/transferrin family substrate-binding protein [Mesorhizobium sp. CAU 1741]|uniref:phosphate/phosphite/phosphonate ABC transporter substrate-binding protein n=1 Tax=Mesorhizobium sp. CAU 1741 TaxID=3140366 RepID=UPI00325AA9D8